MRRAPFGCLASVLLLTLAGCASQRSPYGRYYASSGAYRAPGTAADPWGPYINAAAARFSVPTDWIRAVIHQESGGHEYLNGQPITSSAGAMGLMQLMPSTYADMQDRYGLGPDPYEPHDNIMAGTGYIHILAAKYGAPAFLAAYNAGPQRLESYLNTGRSLPNETVNYVASITPHLGNQIALTGPLAVYGTPDQMSSGATMVAYAPAPVIPMAQPTGQRSVQAVWASRTGTLAAPEPVPCDPDSAYDPNVPCKLVAPMPAQLPAPTSTENTEIAEAPASMPGVQTVAYHPLSPVNSALRLTQGPPPVTSSDFGRWGVQVGAFANPGQARFAATMARQAAFAALQPAQISIQPTVAHGVRFWRARLEGISRSGAARACSSLSGQGMACMAVPPDQQG